MKMSFFLLGLLAVTPVFAQGIAVTLKVDVVTETESKTQGASTRGIHERAVQQKRSLQINLTNASQRELADLTVVYYIFAKDVHSKDIVLAKKGQQTTSVKPLGKAVLNTEDVILTSHSSSSKVTGGRTETTPAGGTKYFGYGVQVTSGNRVLAASFDPPELKSSTNLTEAATAGAVTKTPETAAKTKKKPAN
jgi:hypothetical protein